jgi:hypothetical protein
MGIFSIHEWDSDAGNSPFHVKQVFPEKCAPTEGISSGGLSSFTQPKPPLGDLEPQLRPQSSDMHLRGNSIPFILLPVLMWNLPLCWSKSLKPSHFLLQPWEIAKNFIGFLPVALITLGYKFPAQR